MTSTANVARLTPDEIRAINQAAAHLDIGLELTRSERFALAKQLFAIAGNPLPADVGMLVHDDVGMLKRAKLAEMTAYTRDELVTLVLELEAATSALQEKLTASEMRLQECERMRNHLAERAR